MEDNQFENRMKEIQAKRDNPCPPGEHDYEDHIFTTQSMGTMLHVLCNKCLDMQGWIYQN